HRLFCAALYRAQSCSSLLRASRSSRSQAAESRPGNTAAAAAGRQVRSRSNFGMESAARTRCDAVKTIGNKAAYPDPHLDLDNPQAGLLVHSGPFEPFRRSDRPRDVTVGGHVVLKLFLRRFITFVGIILRGISPSLCLRR